MLVHIHEERMATFTLRPYTQSEWTVNLCMKKWGSKILWLRLEKVGVNWSLQLPISLVFIGCLLSDPILLPKSRIICRNIFEQINAYYTAKYFTECILNETQKDNRINLLNNKQIQLNNTADTINKHRAPVIRIIHSGHYRCNVSLRGC